MNDFIYCFPYQSLNIRITYLFSKIGIYAQHPVVLYHQCNFRVDLSPIAICTEQMASQSTRYRNKIRVHF